jgi:Fic family protein
MSSDPPFQITPQILSIAGEIQRLLGRLEGLESRPILPELRRGHRILTLHASCGIEGNSLSLEQVKTVIAGEAVIAPLKDVLEIQNANRLYEMASKLSPSSERDFLRAHKVLMDKLLDNAGKFRKGNVGIIKGDKVAHVAPKANLVPKLMQNLFRYIKDTKSIPRTIVASIAHYEIEFIHPFADGNGRMGRFWQHLILIKEHPLFALVPFESVIRKRQKEYYSALSASDQAGESTKFIEFSLSALLESLTEVWNTFQPGPTSSLHRRKTARQSLQGKWFSRKEYMTVLKSISSATASRDLNEGVELKELTRSGDKARAKYRFLE